ncbi:MAG: ATP-binding cassette domain-containing protein [Proteobacteria bacterium]|nr:ATP-binding cassette domain-containing protein [Pseudomonadota bacterium]
MNALSVDCSALEVRWRGRLVLGPLQLAIDAGERVSLHGSSGSGKSGLFQAIVRRDAYDRDLRVTGRLSIGGQSAFAERRLDRHRRRVGMVTAFPTMLPGTVYDNVAFAPRMAGLRDRSAVDARVEAALRTAAVWEDVKDRLSEPPTRFSAGQQQRITIARALAQQPGLLLLDQPFTLLDTVTAQTLESALQQLPDTTIIMATPDERRASRFAARVVELHGGSHA